MRQLKELYDAIDQGSRELESIQPWWPCHNCPVIGQEENCCNYAMFLVTKTEWERMKLSPFIIKNRKRLKNDAKATIERLREAGHDTSDWISMVRDFGNKARKFRCPLLSADGWCEVYRDRPFICRAYGVSKQDEETMYGCQIVSDTVNEHITQDGSVKSLKLTEMLDEVQRFAKGPAKPIVAWLAEDL
jgi:Fe-S-cluster containining protein